MKWTKRSVIPYVLILLMTLVVRLPSAPLSVIDSDESNYLVLAQGILRGHLPYTYAFEHKPAGLYFIFALMGWLFGANSVGIRVGGMLVVFATASIIWRLFETSRIQISLIQRYFICLCYILATSGLDGDSVMSEHLMNALTLLWIYLILDWGRARSYYKLLFAGMAMGVSMQVNYLSGYLLAAFAASALAWHLLAYPFQQAVKRYCVFGLVVFGGFLITSAATLAPLAAFSDIGGYFDLQFRYLLHYHSGLTIKQSLEAFAPIAALFFLPFAFLFSAFASGAMAEVLAGFRAKAPTERADDGNLLFLCIVGGNLVGALFASIGSGWMYHHYFLLILPPLFLLYGFALARVGITPFGRTIAAVILLTFGVVAINVEGLRRDLDGVLTAGEILRGAPVRHDPMRQLAASIRPEARNHVLYAPCSSPAIYAMTGATPATIYTYSLYYLEAMYQKAMRLDGEVEVQRALSHQPAVVVLEDEAHCESPVTHETFAMIERELGRAGYVKARQYFYGAMPRDYLSGWLYVKSPQSH